MSEKITKYDLFTPPEIEWPEFDSDRKRIRHYSEKLKGRSIAECFTDVYGDVIDESITNNPEYIDAEFSNTHPVSVGDLIDVTVESLNKHGATVSYHSSKDQLILKQNIATWNVHVGDIIKTAVVGKKRNVFELDCIEPLYQDWLNKVSSTLSNTFQSYEVVVQDLSIQPGGYTGKINIPEISKLMGKSYFVNAFVPGGQITLNRETDFEKWDGKCIDAMVTNFTSKNGVFSAVCSRKKLLNQAGGNSLVNIFDAGYGRGTRFDQITFDGNVTGILNSAKKHVVFVEVLDYNITGVIEKDPVDLVKYHVGDQLKVQIDRFDWDPKKQPYKRNKDGILTEVNIKPVFVEV